MWIGGGRKHDSARTFFNYVSFFLRRGDDDDDMTLNAMVTPPIEPASNSSDVVRVMMSTEPSYTDNHEPKAIL